MLRSAISLLLSSKKNDDVVVVRFKEHDGSLVPVVNTSNVAFAKKLKETLRISGVEILDEVDSENTENSFIIYTQLRTKEEMALLPEGFHPGYSNRTFFETFPEMIDSLDLDNYETFKYFMEQNIDDLVEKHFC